MKKGNICIFALLFLGLLGGYNCAFLSNVPAFTAYANELKADTNTSEAIKEFKDETEDKSNTVIAIPGAKTTTVIEPSAIILAQVEGENITEQDLLNTVQGIGAQGKELLQNNEARQAILNDIITTRLLALEAKKAHIDESEEYKVIEREITSRILAQLAVQDIVKAIKITSEDAKAFYDTNIDRFVQPELIHVKHILISDDKDSSDTIVKVQTDLKNGTTFEETARKYSICSSAQQGGDLGTFPRGQMVAEFDKVAFALKAVGEVSEPVKTQFGWHIIKLEGRSEAVIMPFEQVEEQLLQEMQNFYMNELLNKHLENLRNIYKVKIFTCETCESSKGRE